MVTNFWFTALPWVHYLNFQDKELYHAARFEKAIRYYVIRLEKDLLDDWIINIWPGTKDHRFCRHLNIITQENL